jgi:GTPase involved in cell partitioning and DNA repair
MWLQVREELRMYNPEYCARPHVVVLNKFDLPVRHLRVCVCV